MRETGNGVLAYRFLFPASRFLSFYRTFSIAGTLNLRFSIIIWVS